MSACVQRQLRQLRRKLLRAASPESLLAPAQQAFQRQACHRRRFRQGRRRQVNRDIHAGGRYEQARLQDGNSRRRHHRSRPSRRRSVCIEPASGSDDGIIPAVTKDGIKIMSINLLLPNETDPVVWRGPGHRRARSSSSGRTCAGETWTICSSICLPERATCR